MCYNGYFYSLERLKKYTMVAHKSIINIFHVPITFCLTYFGSVIVSGNVFAGVITLIMWLFNNFLKSRSEFGSFSQLTRIRILSFELDENLDSAWWMNLNLSIIWSTFYKEASITWLGVIESSGEIITWNFYWAHSVFGAGSKGLRSDLLFYNFSRGKN